MEPSNKKEERIDWRLVREVIVPIGSLIIALAGIMLSAYSLTTQVWLQESQMKYKGYGALMGELRRACSEAPGREQLMGEHVDKAWAEYYLLETFVNVDERQGMRNSFISVVQALEDVHEAHDNPPALEKAINVFYERHKAFGAMIEEHLYLGKG